MHRFPGTSTPSRRYRSCLIITAFLGLTLFLFSRLGYDVTVDVSGITLDSLNYYNDQNKINQHDNKDNPPSYRSSKGNSISHDMKLSSSDSGYRSSETLLSDDDFKPNKRYFQKESIRYESVETWRSPDSFIPTYPPNVRSRPRMPHWSEYSSMGQYLQQPLVADYAEGAEKIFLMIKDGANVIWERLPMHFLTTLTRVPNFAIYADKAGSIAGYEVVDVLANVTEETFNSDHFEKYRRLKFLHDSHNVFDGSQLYDDSREGWWLDRFKNIPMLAHAYSVSPTSDWFVFMDADTFFFMDVLTSWLMTLDPEEPLYLGSRHQFDHVLPYPYAHGGSGVVLSRKALELTLGEHPEYVQEYEKKAFDCCCGDALVSMMLKEKLDIEISSGDSYPHVGQRFQQNPFQDLLISEGYWCGQVHSFHQLWAHDFEILYEYERLRGPLRNNISYADMYKDFYLPYIDNKVENWDNWASSVEFRESDYPDSREKDELGGLKPHKSFETCREACELYPWCVNFRFVAGNLNEGSYCGLSHDVRLGRYTADWLDRDGYRETTSGWLVDRIRDMRKRQWCDSLFETRSDIERLPDGSENDDVEGWYLRRKGLEGKTKIKTN